MGVICWAMGVVGPVAEQVIFSIEQIQFEHEIFADVEVECRLRWCAKLWKRFPVGVEG